MIFKYTNISIIIETDSFDYEEFGKTWGRVLSQIKFHVKSVYFYVHRHNKFSHKYKNSRGSLDTTLESLKKMVAANISFPRVIISDFPDNGHLPLMISSYTDDMYPLQVVCYIDARNIQHKRHISNLINDRSKNKNLLTQWIEKSYEMHINNPSLASIFGFQTEVKINQNILPKNYNYNANNQLESTINDNKIIKKTVGCDIVMVKETVIRELLYYTKVSMDSPSPFLTLSLINDLKVQNSYDNLISSDYIQNVDFYPFSKSQKQKSIINTKANEEFKCPDKIDKEFDNTTFSVFIPCFKRNYFDLILPRMDNQTLQPSYYVLIQNRFYRYINVEGELSHYLVKNVRPIYKIWMVNYNSFFVLPNLITSLINTDFVFRFDDDHIPTNNNLFSHIMRTEFIENKYKDIIIGDRFSVLNIKVGNFINKSIQIICQGNRADYVASPYIYRPYQMKLPGRIRPFFLGGGEDAHFGLSAAIECDTISRRVKFNYKDFSGDEFRHGIDKEIQDYIHSTLNYSGYLIHNVYNYYVRIGLKPRCWRNFIIDPNDRINGSKYLHTPFF